MVINSNGGVLSLNNDNNNNVLLGAGGGNVGIGTTSPQKKLHIQSNGSDYGTIRIYRDSTTQGEVSIGFFGKSNSNNNEAWIIGEGGWAHPNDFVIGNENSGAGGNVRMLIQRDGNVGIGTTDPGSNRLRVLGGAVQFEKDGHTAGSDNYSLELRSPILSEIREISIRFHQSGRWYHQIRSSGAGFRLTAGESSTTVPLTAGNILSTGIVGVGTVSPTSAIHVKNATPEIKLEAGSTTDSGTMRYNSTTKSIEFIFA